MTTLSKYKLNPSESNRAGLFLFGFFGSIFDYIFDYIFFKNLSLFFTFFHFAAAEIGQRKTPRTLET